jgi:predicted nucleic-acid-binding Zn-ribbon protein
MVEDLSVMVTNGGYGVDVREKGMFKSSVGKLKCAVCPECGYTEIYLEDTARLKKLTENK